MLESGNLKAEGTITRVDKRFRLKLVLTFGNVRGERVIDSDSCGDLAGAAAVALGLLLQSATQTSSTDPNATTGTGATSPNSGGVGNDSEANATTSNGSAAAPAGTQSKSPEARTPDAPGSTDPKPNDARGTRHWRAFIQAPELAANFGPLAEPTLGFAFALGLSVRPWSFGVGVQLPRKQQLELTGSSGAGASLNYLATEAWACRGWRSTSFELAPCLTFGVEHLSATGTGSGVEPLSERATWVSVGAAAHGRWYVAEWFALSATAGARVEGARPTIRIDGLGGSERLKPAAFALRAGPMWIF